jgi:hypothetical protein
MSMRACGLARIDIAYTAPDKENGVITFFDAAGNPLGTMAFTDIDAIIPCFSAGSRIISQNVHLLFHSARSCCPRASGRKATNPRFGCSTRRMRPGAMKSRTSSSRSPGMRRPIHRASNPQRVRGPRAA